MRASRPGWLALDVASVLAFVVIGRAAHERGLALAGVASTAWPFLAGLAAGWGAARAWRGPTSLLPAGVAAWLSCVALGMVLRVVSGQGTALAFILVSLGFLGATMLGWRLALLGLWRLPGAGRRGTLPH